MPTGSPEQGYAFKKGGRGKGYEQQQMRSSRGKAATHATAAAAHAHSRGDHRRLVRTSMTRCCAATISACGRETCAAKQPTVARRSPRTGRPAFAIRAKPPSMPRRRQSGEVTAEAAGPPRQAAMRRMDVGLSAVRRGASADQQRHVAWVEHHHGEAAQPHAIGIAEHILRRPRNLPKQTRTCHC